MLSKFDVHNKFKQDLTSFLHEDPQLSSLAKLRYQHSADWWSELSLGIPGIYILTGGRQIGKSTSCKLLIAHCLQQKIFLPSTILYLPCDEIYDASELSRWMTQFLDSVDHQPFLLIIDEITFVKHWERVIKSLADQGRFSQGICLLTGSDTLILKEAAMSFPGRRGHSDRTDFHIYPLSFFEYVALVSPESKNNQESLSVLFNQYLQCGGYLRAINDFAEYGAILPSTLQTYEQWIRGDFLKKGKKERYLLDLLYALLSVGVSQISYSALTEKIGSISKETCLDYCDLLQRMDVVFDLQAYDQNKKLGFPKKARKFHFVDPFIRRAIQSWLAREGYSLNKMDEESFVVESIVASHCHRYGRAFYFKGQGEIDVIHVVKEKVTAIEVKWANQIRASDLKMLKQFHDTIVVTKNLEKGFADNIKFFPVYQFLVEHFSHADFSGFV